MSNYYIQLLEKHYRQALATIAPSALEQWLPGFGSPAMPVEELQSEYLRRLNEDVDKTVRDPSGIVRDYCAQFPRNILKWEGSSANCRTREDAKEIMLYNVLKGQKIDCSEPATKENVTQSDTMTADSALSRSLMKSRNIKRTKWDFDKWDPYGDKIPRPYQREPVERLCLREESLLVNLPTGTGKTLIAAMAANYFLDASDRKVPAEKVVAFFVPTRTLVEQQAQYMKDHCRVDGKKINPDHVLEIAGMEVGDWDAHKWREYLKFARIVVGTPEVFRKAMVDCTYIKPQDFSLLIFDEAHHAVKNSATANIFRRVMEEPKEERPRCLGLTASWLNSANQSCDAKLEDLLRLMQAQICIPDVDPNLISGEPKYTKVFYQHKCDPVTLELSTGKEVKIVGATEFSGRCATLVREEANVKSWFVQLNDGTEVSIKEDDLAPATIKDRVSAITDELLAGMEAICKDSAKGKLHSCNVFAQLGFHAWLFYLEHGLINEGLNQAKNCSKSDIKKAVGRAKTRQLEAWRGTIQRKLTDSDKEKRIEALEKDCNKYSGKVDKLLELLNDIIDNDPDPRILLFVQEICISLPLMDIVNKEVSREGPDENKLPICAYSAGINAMDNDLRKSNVLNFKNGKYKIMVATASLEEGLDVAECNHVISFNDISTVKSHIQKSGRARAQDAKIWYFENDPDKEKGKAREMEEVAKKQAKNDVPLASPSPSHYVFDFGTYPYKDPSTEMKVELLNCVNLFHEYVQAVFAQKLSPKKMVYEHHEDKTILRIYVPHPDGIKYIDEIEVRETWGTSEMALNAGLFAKTFHTDVKGKTDWVERQYVMTGIIWLLRKGHIRDGKATDSARIATRGHPECVALLNQEMPLTFHNRWGVNAMGVASATVGREQLIEAKLSRENTREQLEGTIPEAG